MIVNNVCLIIYGPQGKNFSKYAVFREYHSRIYCQWIEVLLQTENFQNPWYKGFHNFQEAVEVCKKM